MTAAGAAGDKALETWQPRLRGDVAFLELAEGWFLTDEARGLVVVVDEARFQAARLFDGSRTVARVRFDLEAGGVRIAGPTLDKLTRQLMFLHLFEGTGDDARMAHILARAKGSAHVRSVPIAVLDGTRFACQMCGSCCRVSLRGPISADEVVRISAYPWIARYPRLAERNRLFESADVEGRATHMLATDEGRCVFLSEENRCLIHQESGGTAKPAACQLFPYLVIPTVQDLTVFDSGECETFHISSTRGPTPQEDIERLRAVILDLATRTELFHPTVQFPAGIDIDFAHYLPLESYLVGFVELELGDVADTLVAIRNVLFTYQDVLLKSTLEPGLPDRLKAEIPSLDPKPFLPAQTPPDPESDARFYRALDVLLKAVLKQLHEAVGFAFTREVSHLSFPTPVFRELCQLIESYRAMIAPPGGEAWNHLSEAQRRHARTAMKLQIPALKAFDDYFRRGLRQRLHGKTLVRVDSRLDAGYLHFVLVHLLTCAGARLRAADAQRSTVSLADLDRTQSALLRGLKPHLFPGMLSSEKRALQECFLRVTPELLRR